jgi:hypothetical protein
MNFILPTNEVSRHPGAAHRGWKRRSVQRVPGDPWMLSGALVVLRAASQQIG